MCLSMCLRECYVFLCLPSYALMCLSMCLFLSASAFLSLRTLLETVNAISTTAPALDTLETQYVQSFYDTTYRAHMIRCLVQALKLYEHTSGGLVGGEEREEGGVAMSKNLIELRFVDNCVHVFSELVLTSSKFMKQVKKTFVCVADVIIFFSFDVL
jgi:hypothetical protein